ncbi:DUF3298 and DUF4163 domain-containing protein [Sabulilitoribacter arenilitoris]|uniref:DUF3298 and DUF4163 domain-containing protein n=1 Tax=Wocania arenilitoris TaxID=2044858 RepID=A0AAE3JK90_9FLAO|nr:DUF3298 and DUF4163 domain-containing protein [Wocania arenilitoris]MCF7566904.1 DUF3298 and DUF4163 domain-containing protein [Wocania arenilitoris]
MLKNNYLLVVCAFFMLSSCKEKTQITFYETNLTSKNNHIIEVNIPLAIANDKVAKAINSTIKSYIITALQIEESNDSVIKSVEESIENFNNEYNSFISKFPESTQEWEAQIDGEVIFKTPYIISVSLTAYTNTGGAHGNLNISFLNFNASTGETIENNKLFKNINAFKKIAKAYFKANLEDKDLIFDTENFQLPKNIGYSDDGIILLYNTYEIAPYASDIIEFSIPFEVVKPYLIFNRF